LNVAKEQTANATDGAMPKARSRTKIILFVVIPLLILLLIGGGGAYFYFGQAKDEHHDAVAEPVAKPMVYYNLPDLLVNMGGGSGQKVNFLKMTISLELSDSADVVRVQAVMPRLVSNVQAYLRELRVVDLRGSAALERVRSELLDRINAAANPTRVNNVLFLEVMIQ
jgi:flagellar protein FliL